MTNTEKQAELDKLLAEIKEYKGLDIARKATNPVLGEGDPDSEIMFIGEAPGFHEDQQGRPFVGLAGKLLEKTLQEIGLQRSEVYITNIVKFRPPENRDPTPEEIEACKGWLDQQIEIINPRVIVTLGRFSMAKFLGPQSISRIHGQHRRVSWTSPSGKMTNPIIFPMYHPAAALRAGEMMKAFKEDFFNLGKLIQDGAVKVEKLVPDKKEDDKPVQDSLF